MMLVIRLQVVLIQNVQNSITTYFLVINNNGLTSEVSKYETILGCMIVIIGMHTLIILIADTTTIKDIHILCRFSQLLFMLFKVRLIFISYFLIVI